MTTDTPRPDETCQVAQLPVSHHWKPQHPCFAIAEWSVKYSNHGLHYVCSDHLPVAVNACFTTISRLSNTLETQLAAFRAQVITEVLEAIAEGIAAKEPSVGLLELRGMQSSYLWAKALLDAPGEPE